MKKNKLLALSLLTLASISLSSCTNAIQGEKGDQGEQGLPGQKGDQGVPGENGLDGATWLTGSGEPSSSSGEIGDLYLDTSNGDVYQKSATGWVLITNLTGEDGKDGENGQDGQDGQPGDKGDKGDQGEKGEDGKDGSSWLTGSGVPSSDLGNVGDLYLDTLTGDIYLKGETGWSFLTSLKGEDGNDGLDGVNGDKGDQGEQGATAYSSTILPSENGTIIPLMGSQVVDENITFRFMPNEGYRLKSYSLDGNKNVTEVTDSLINQSYDVTIKMQEGGFVVSATFVKVVSVTNEEGTTTQVNLGTSDVHDDSEVSFSGSFTLASDATFASNNSVIDLSKAKVTANSANTDIVVSGEGNTIIVGDESSFVNTNLKIDGNNNTVVFNGSSQESFSKITVRGYYTTLQGSYSPLVRSNPTTFDFEGTIYASNLSASNLTIKNMSMKLDNITCQAQTHDITIDSCYIVVNSKSYLALSAKDFTFTNNYVVKSSDSWVFNFQVAKQSNYHSVTIDNNTFDYNGFGGGIGKLTLRNKDVSNKVTNNKFINIDEASKKGFAFDIEANYSLPENTTLEDNLGVLKVDLSGNEMHYKNKVESSFKSSLIVMSRDNTSNNDNYSNSLIELTIDDVDVYVGDEESPTLLSVNGSVSKGAIQRGAVNGTSAQTYTGLFIDGVLSRLVTNTFPVIKTGSESESLSLNYEGSTFYNGIYYDVLNFDANGEVNETLSIRGDSSVKFSGGRGTDSDPLLVSSVEDFQSLNKMVDGEYVSHRALTFKLTDDIEVTNADFLNGFNGKLIGETKEDGSKPVITVNNTSSELKTLLGNGRHVEIENIEFNMTDAYLMGSTGSNYAKDIDLNGLNDAIIVKNCKFTGSVVTKETRSFNNEGLICANVHSDILQLENNIIETDIDVTSGTGSYCGLLVGGYFYRNTSKSQVIIKNNEFKGTFVGEQVGFIFGNNNAFSNDYNAFVTYEVSGNKNNGTIKGYSNADFYFANATESYYNSIANGTGKVQVRQKGILDKWNDTTNTETINVKGTISKVDHVTTLTKQDKTINISYSGQVNVGKIEVFYGMYSKVSTPGYSGTEYFSFEDTNNGLGYSSTTTSITIKDIAYSEYKGTSDVVKFTLPSDRYLVDADDNRTSVTVSSNFTIIVRIYDNDGNLIDVVKQNI